MALRHKEGNSLEKLFSSWVDLGGGVFPRGEGLLLGQVGIPLSSSGPLKEACFYGLADTRHCVSVGQFSFAVKDGIFSAEGHDRLKGTDLTHRARSDA